MVDEEVTGTLLEVEVMLRLVLPILVIVSVGLLILPPILKLWFMYVDWILEL